MSTNTVTNSTLSAARKRDEMLEPYEWKRSRTVLRREGASNRPDLVDDYAVQAFIIPACAVDAPHRRDRCAIIGCRTLEEKHNGKGWRPNSLENSDCVRFGKQGILSQQPRRTKFERDGKDVANADCNGLEEQGMQGLPEKQEASVANGGWWPAEPDVGRISYGVPSRVDRLKCLGNAVVPQQFYPIFRAIADIERGIIHG